MWDGFLIKKYFPTVDVRAHFIIEMKALAISALQEIIYR